VGLPLPRSYSPCSIVFPQSTIAFLSGIPLAVPTQPLLLAVSYSNPIPHYCFHSPFCSFNLRRPGGPLSAGESLPAPQPWLCKVCTVGLALCVCFAGASASYQSAERHRIWPYVQVRSSHMARSIWEHFRLKREKKKEDKSGKEKDAAVKNTSIGSSKKPPYCIHYYNLLICSGLMLHSEAVPYLISCVQSRAVHSPAAGALLQCPPGTAECRAREPAIKMNKDPFVYEKAEKKYLACSHLPHLLLL